MRQRKRYRNWLLLLAVGALIMGACKTSVGLKFSHRFHLVEQGATCDQCHKSDDKGNFKAATMADCQECHEFNPDEPSPECLLCHTPESAADDYAIKASAKPGSFADLIFSHETHADFSCDRCHTGIGRDRGLNSGPSMTTCTDCHKTQEGPLD